MVNNQQQSLARIRYRNQHRAQQRTRFYVEVALRGVWRSQLLRQTTLLANPQQAVFRIRMVRSNAASTAHRYPQRESQAQVAMPPDQKRPVPHAAALAPAAREHAAVPIDPQ